MKLQFYLRFHTEFGQSLWITGNADELGNNDPSGARAMEYLDNEFWTASIDIDKKDLPKGGIQYKYFLKTKEGELIIEWGHDRFIEQFRKDLNEIRVVDTWNHAGEYENSFFTAPYTKVLLKQSSPKSKTKASKEFTHIFKIKAKDIFPVKTQVLCLDIS